MIKVQMPYGYKTLQIGNMNILTAKIRVKTDLETVSEFITTEDRLLGVNYYHGKNGTVIITWATDNRVSNQYLVSKTNSLLAYVMHRRIAIKYGELVDTPVDLEW